MVFQWKQGARIKADAQQAGILCSKLETEGRLTAKALLEPRVRRSMTSLSGTMELPLKSIAKIKRGTSSTAWLRYMNRHRQQEAFSTSNAKQQSTDQLLPLCKIRKAEISFYRWRCANLMRSSRSSVHCQNWLRYLRPSKKFRKRGLHE